MEIELNSFKRLKYAYKNKLPVGLAVSRKRINQTELGKNFIENNEYWDRDKEVANLLELVKQKDLREIYEEYDVSRENLLMSYYDHFGADEKIKVFIEDYLMQLYSETTLKQIYETWTQNNTRDVQITKNTYKKVLDAQNWLNKEKKNFNFKTSPINIISATLEGDIRIRVKEKGAINYYPIETKNGFDIFLNSLISMELPFISYKGDSNSETHIKVFTGELPYTLDKIKPSDSQLNQPHTIQTVVWSEKDDFSKASLESFVVVTIDLSVNKISFSSKITERNIVEDEPVIAKRIQRHLPLKVLNLRENNITGEYVIYGLDLNISLFLDLIMMNKYAREFIYMDESSSQYSIKKRIGFYLRQPLLEFSEALEGKRSWDRYFSFILHEEIFSQAEELPMIDYFVKTGKKDLVAVTKNMPYIKIIISKSADRDTLQLGLLLFTSMIGIFREREKNLLEEYRQYNIKFGHEDKVWELKTTKGKKLNVIKGEINKDLQNAAPSIFVKGYGTEVCQRNDQPVIIPPDLVEKWNAKHIGFENAVPFPHPNAEIYLGCGERNPSKPFVSLKEHNLSNQDEYPYMPCCTAKNYQEPGSHSLFTHYYLGEEIISKKTAPTSEITSRKILIKDQTGLLPPMIESTFKLLRILNKGDDFKRLGVNFSKYSALRCLLTIVNDKEYNKFYFKGKTDFKAELKVEEYLYNMIKNSFKTDKVGKKEVFPSVLSQELYDIMPDEIEEKMLEMEYFDTREFYRWLEIKFNLSVFVFYISPDQKITLEIPRHKFFHARPFVKRESVILLKHWGSNPEQLNYPQYEIIMKNNQMTWDLKTSKRLTKMMHKLQNTYQIELREIPTLHKNPYAIENFGDLFPNAISQYIDEAGKLRGFTIPLSENNIENRITIYTPPSQPLNLPNEDSEFSIEIDYAIKIFDRKPSRYSMEGDMISGLWFPIFDIEEGIYIPIIEMSFEDYDEYNLEISKGRDNPYYSYGDSILEPYHNIEKMRRIYLQCLLWSYLVYSKQEYNPVKVRDFLQKYTKIENFNFLIPLKEINTSLPYTHDINYALKYLSSYFPFVRENKFLCTNKQMYEKIEYFLIETVNRFHNEKPVIEKRIELNPTFNRPEHNLTTLQSLFNTPEDFPKTIDSQIFMSIPEFKTWLFNKLYGRGDKMLITEKMDLSMSTIKNPFLYRHRQTNQIYIVQNVSLGDESRAVQNAITYRETEKNLGYETSKYPLYKQVYRNILVITSGGDLEFFTQKEGKDLQAYKENPITLLNYDDEIYASLIKVI